MVTLLLDSPRHLFLVLLFLWGHIAHLGMQKIAVLPAPSASTLHAHAMLTWLLLSLVDSMFPSMPTTLRSK